ncbi:MAG: hypothetical protein JWO31_4231 [Phycisphaerales bacterium]|nr:hypothetical protein [Phycisphaerales bacterium]
MEWRCEHTIEAAADPGVVWQLFRDVPGWPRWNAGAERIDIAGPFQTGTEFRMTVPGPERQTLTSRLLAVAEGESFEDETRVGDVVVRVLHRVRPTGAGRCRIAFSLVAVGPDRAEVGGAASADFPDVLKALARVAEETRRSEGR